MRLQHDNVLTCPRKVENIQDLHNDFLPNQGNGCTFLGDMGTVTGTYISKIMLLKVDYPSTVSSNSCPNKDCLISGRES